MACLAQNTAADFLRLLMSLHAIGPESTHVKDVIEEVVAMDRGTMSFFNQSDYVTTLRSQMTEMMRHLGELNDQAASLSGNFRLSPQDRTYRSDLWEAIRRDAGLMTNDQQCTIQMHALAPKGPG